MISKNLQRFVKGFVNQSRKTMSVQQRSFYEIPREPEFPVIDKNYFLFNVFEPVPDNKKFKNFWLEKAIYIQREEKEKFVETHLHHSESSSFPWVNFAVFASEDVVAFGRPDPKWTKGIKNMPNTLKASPAGYRLVGTTSGENYNSKDAGEGKGCILSLVETKGNESHENIISNWEQSTMTDVLRSKLQKNSHSLSDSYFFRRFCAVPRFPFVVRTPTSFENVQEGIEVAEHMNKMSQPKEDVKVTFGYYVVDTSMYTKI